NADPRVRNIMDSLFTGPWCEGDENRFRMIFDEIMSRGDQFYVLADFAAYNKACERADVFYSDRKKWAKSCILNVAASGFFTSDRTIEEYNRDIWHLNPLKAEEND
ncbi:MAG: glycogen/starch/alpha-glucan phosphorylase, partial [Bacilli bacterium]|nr:glycogen/starch/alpha-glucan phosphorylase [Bacilli bacterium]